MKDRLFDVLKQAKADYAEVRFEHEDSTSITYRGREVEDVSASKLRGGIARACTRGGWGLATFDSLDDLEYSVAEACQCAALVGKEKTQLADTPVVDKVIPAKLERDFRGVSFDDKLALAAGYNDIILKADPAIETSRVGYADSFRTVHFASSRGTYYCEERPKVSVYYSGTAREGALVQRALDGVSSAVTYDEVARLEDKVLEVARRAAALLKAPQCPGGKFTVILDQELGGVFAHEAFGHLSEADFLHENPKMRELMHLGRKMGVKQLEIVDDGAMGQLIGTHAFDDEGTPTGRTHLIKEGVLVGHLHSLETAAKMGEKPTGNARTVNRTHPPIVRMTNTYIGNGELSFDELVGGVDKGIYACGLLGGQTMMEMFTFSAAYGYRIEGGRIGELVRDVVLTGNVFETLHAINGFGDDLKMVQKGAGGCGKGAQSPLPVTFGSPHLRVENVVIGGR
ncbi:MAG: hypothetical protein AMJ81_08220 [Phycisphaerae bacterium SM23_33]|nr:MAG: hypothetical protein AMJ81_08220 [Phycisphaerae bacterium SM23_33]